MCGDGPELGRWRADAVRLDWRDGAFRSHVELPPGSRTKYLFTRGSWRGAELDHDGCELRPREVTADHDTVHAEVPGWGRGSVRTHSDLPSTFLPHPHTVLVHLPPEYDLHPHRRYPVLYLHDGQNLFDADTSFAGVPWRCDEAAEELARLGEMTPIIQVGIYNTPDRLKEYGPTDDAHDLSAGYGRFLLDEVKPLIDREYRTRIGPENTGICGSSMGGLISLELARRHPSVFGRCAALSPSLWWNGERLLHDIGDHPQQLSHCRVWLDMGSREGPSSDGLPPMVRRARRLAFHLRNHPEGEFRYTEVDGGMHNEWAWSARFPDVLRYLFPKL